MTLQKALDIRLFKAKYLKRTGSPGHYRYVYREKKGRKKRGVEEEKQVKGRLPSFMRNLKKNPMSYNSFAAVVGSTSKEPDLIHYSRDMAIEMLMEEPPFIESEQEAGNIVDFLRNNVMLHSDLTDKEAAAIKKTSKYPYIKREEDYRGKIVIQSKVPISKFYSTEFE